MDVKLYPINQLHRIKHHALAQTGANAQWWPVDAIFHHWRWCLHPQNVAHEALLKMRTWPRRMNLQLLDLKSEESGQELLWAAYAGACWRFLKWRHQRLSSLSSPAASCITYCKTGLWDSTKDLVTGYRGMATLFLELSADVSHCLVTDTYEEGTTKQMMPSYCMTPSNATPTHQQEMWNRREGWCSKTKVMTPTSHQTMKPNKSSTTNLDLEPFSGLTILPRTYSELWLVIMQITHNWSVLTWQKMVVRSLNCHATNNEIPSPKYFSEFSINVPFLAKKELKGTLIGTPLSTYNKQSLWEMI